jgi:hypothetical protein
MKDFFSLRRIWRRQAVPESPAAVFQCYFLDEGGGIQDFENVATDNLDRAVERVLALLAERPQTAGFELWQGTRRLHTHIRTRV